MTHRSEGKINRDPLQFSAALGHVLVYTSFHSKVLQAGKRTKTKIHCSHAQSRGIPRPSCSLLSWYLVTMSSYVVRDKQALIVLSRKVVTNFIHDPATKSLPLDTTPHLGFYSSMWLWEDRNIWTIVTFENKIINNVIIFLNKIFLIYTYHICTESVYEIAKCS